jgi:orotate phosphoribosyltransferase
MESLRARAFGIIRERSFGRRRIVLASGRESDFYFDMKPTMFHPEGAALLTELIIEKLAGIKVDYIAGMEMGAVPLIAAVTLLSYQQGRPIPGFFVRKSVKDHGTKKLIDGVHDGIAGKNVVILEDVTTTGDSAMTAVNAVQAAGGRVVLVLTLVDREEGAVASFEAAGLAFDWIYAASEFLAA